MKIRILPVLVAGVMAASAFLSSCLGNDYGDIEYPSESSIKSFSVGTLHQTFYGKDSKGNDSVYVDTVSYADVPFTIDQINRRIYNKDSLPKEVDITRVVTSISADNAVYYEKNGKDTIWSSADSLDFTNNITLKVMAYSKIQNNFVFGEPYTVTLNVHKLNPDSLVWKHFGDKKFENNSILTEQKAIYNNEEIYVFGKTANGEFKVNKASVTRGNITSDWEEVAINTTDVNIYSATALNGKIYYIANDELYTLENQGTKVGNLTGLTNILCVSNNYLMVYKKAENEIVSIDSEGNELSEGKSKFVSGYDLKERLSAISTPSLHNSSLWRTIVMTNDNDGTVETDTTANVFSYISSDTEWVKYQPNNPTTCPNQENISMISYDGKLFAYGEKFDYFYSSTDNGLNWKKEEEYMLFPDKQKESSISLETYRNGGSYSTVSEENGNKGSFIWFIWQDGSMTRACLNRLLPKE
ncbi:MAG: hypothetical protein H9802_09265 [Candidatus Phocaeicola faecipullorum]|nr:hypothetical protein [Candidatus Phocaeicola faecipullorum]